MTRYAHRIDETQPEVIAALHAMGVWVWDTSGVGAGFPDLVCAYQGRLRLVEIKTRKRGLTAAEVKAILACPVRIHIVRSADEAIELVNQWRRDADV